MIIKILGGGCPKCERLENLTRSVVEELGMEAEFIKVKSMPEIMAYEVLSTPALVVNEKLLSYGRIPDREVIREWIEQMNES